MSPEIIAREVVYKATRSSGAGGQHVNKVATRIQLFFYPQASAALTESEKERIASRLAHHLTDDGALLVVCSEGRSQLANKEKALKKLLQWLAKTLRPDTVRKPTRTPRSAVEKRLKFKKNQSEKKAFRRFKA